MLHKTEYAILLILLLITRRVGSLISLAAEFTCLLPLPYVLLIILQPWEFITGEIRPFQPFKQHLEARKQVASLFIKKPWLWRIRNASQHSMSLKPHQSTGLPLLPSKDMLGSIQPISLMTLTCALKTYPVSPKIRPKSSSSF